MKTLKFLRNAFLLFYFGWMAVAGIGAVGLLYWLTPLTASLGKIVVVGASLGILLGGMVATMALLLLWNRYKAVLRTPFALADMLLRRL